MSDVNIPIIIGHQGVETTPPAELYRLLLENVASKVPGYTGDLPASLIGDMASTAQASISLIDQARVDTINSVSPYGANLQLLDELSEIYGTTRTPKTNVSVFVSFTGSPGYEIQRGFRVGDNGHTYLATESVVIPVARAGQQFGTSEPVLCVAQEDGDWAVPVGTVNQLQTSVPEEYTVMCNNLTEGEPGTEQEGLGSFRRRVMDEGMFAVQGTPTALKAALARIPGVLPNLIAFRQPVAGKWVVVCGGQGFSRFAVANAIYSAIPDISALTNDVKNPDGSTPIKEERAIISPPDVYIIPYVVPSSQLVTVTINWSSTQTALVNLDAINADASKAIAEYISGITVGDPISKYQIEAVFIDSVTKQVERSTIAKVEATIRIDGKVPTNVGALVQGQTYSYFDCNESGVTVIRDSI